MLKRQICPNAGERVKLCTSILVIHLNYAFAWYLYCDPYLNAFNALMYGCFGFRGQTRLDMYSFNFLSPFTSENSIAVERDSFLDSKASQEYTCTP